MTISEKIAQRLYVAAIGAVTTVVTQRLLTLAWKTATGSKPPTPGDPQATLGAVVIWTAASSVGLAAGRVVTQRLTLRHLARRAEQVAEDIAD